MFIDASTPREDLVEALTGCLDGIQFCIDRGIDPDDPHVETETIRQAVIDFIAAGDECGSCA